MEEMSTSLPARGRSEQVESFYSREEAIAAIRDFYKLLIKLPYVDPSALVYPPPEGWWGVNAAELRARGKTQEVIELLRHLPYLRPPAPEKRWMIGPGTIEIAYCDGELYPTLIESMQPVPEHCIWLTVHESRDGTDLLLDTQTGTITEWTMLGYNVIVDYEEYESIPAQDQWMAHATMPVTAFWRRWTRKFERLIWMALFDARGLTGTAQWYVAATTKQDEEDMLASDDDFEPDGDEHGDVDEGGSGPDSEDEMDDVAVQISDEEVDAFMEDPYGDEAHQKRMELQSQENASQYTSVDPPLPEPEDRRPADWKVMDQKTKEVREIYTRSGWPSNFNREECQMSLAEFRGREQVRINLSQDFQFRRQKIMEREKRRQRGRG